MKAQLATVVLAFLIFAQPAAGQVSSESVLFEDFESISPPALPAGWTSVNANGDLGVWETKAYGGVNWGRQCIRYISDPSNPGGADDWFFTSGIDLSDAELYTLEFQYRSSSAANPEVLVVSAGTAPDPLAMTIGIWANGAIVNTEYEKASAGLTVPASSTYYIGFHVQSPATSKRLYVDDMNVLVPRDQLELHLAMTKSLYGPGIPTYTAGDTIECFVALENISGGPLVVYEQLSLGEGVTDTQLGFDIIGPDGLPVPMINKPEKSGPPGAVHFTILEPDSIVGKVVGLWGWYGFELPGNYSIEAHYQNYSDPGGIGAWTGEVLSNPVDIILE
jgi:hypothetical protein